MSVKLLTWFYYPDVNSFIDYYPFGALMPSRNSNSGAYRYSFNGMEQDEEVKNNPGNHYTTEFRQYDPRLGKWLSVDPLFSNFPWQSPYAAFDNNPVVLTDPEGLAAGNGDDDVKTYEGGVQVYQAAAAKNVVPKASSKAGESFKVGDYSVLPNYTTNEAGEEELSFYTASVRVNEITAEGIKKTSRVDYIFGKDDLANFKDKVNIYGAAANLMFGAGTKLSDWQINQLNGKSWVKGYLKEQWTNPYNLIAMAHMFVGGLSPSNKVNLKSSNYKPVAAQYTNVKNVDVLKHIQKNYGQGSWIKVYEAGYIKGKAVEVHYFLNKNTGDYFDSKIARQGWDKKFTKGANKITGQ